MNVDTGEMAAFTEELDELGGEVAAQSAMTTRLIDVLSRLLDVTSPVLLDAAARGRQHNDRSDSIRHTGRHRRHRPPPWCGDGT